jgi:hypothetical protein
MTALLLTSAAAAADHGSHCAASVAPTESASAWIASAPPIATPSLLAIARRSAATLTPGTIDLVDAVAAESSADSQAPIRKPSPMADGGQLSANALYQRVLKYQWGSAARDPAPTLAQWPNADPNCLTGSDGSAG